MTNQTELLAALDRAIEELRASYLRFSNERDDEKTIVTLIALRDQIAKGPVAIAEFKGEDDERFLNDVYWLEASNELIAGEHKLYALTVDEPSEATTGADR